MDDTDISIDFDGGSVYAGSVCGYADKNTIIDNCYNTGSIYVSDETAKAGAAGISGSASPLHRNTVFITNCYNTGAVHASGGIEAVAGGISGYGYEIRNCFNTGTVRATSDSLSVAAGIDCADFTSAGLGYVYNCFNLGKIESYSNRDAIAYGINTVKEIINYCYIDCDFELWFGYDTVNSFLNEIGNLKNEEGYEHAFYCFVNVERKYKTHPAGNSKVVFDDEHFGVAPPRGLTGEQMKDAGSFAGFDFENVWAISAEVNGGYPFLRVSEGE
jgi:hypothetical protein